MKNKVIYKIKKIQYKVKFFFLVLFDREIRESNYIYNRKEKQNKKFCWNETNKQKIFALDDSFAQKMKVVRNRAISIAEEYDRLIQEGHTMYKGYVLTCDFVYYLDEENPRKYKLSERKISIMNENTNQSVFILACDNSDKKIDFWKIPEEKFVYSSYPWDYLISFKKIDLEGHKFSRLFEMLFYYPGGFSLQDALYMNAQEISVGLNVSFSPDSE